MRIGVLGGTFNPVHYGHLYLAAKLCDELALSKIIFMPAYLPPHKKNVNIVSAKHRYNMLKMIIKRNKKFQVSDIEIRRKGRSYSVETLRELRLKYPKDTEIFFITGSDSLRELGKWKNLKEILSLSKFVVVKRPGFKIMGATKGFIVLRIGAKNISSTQVRSRIRNKLSISRLAPKDVGDYIAGHKLYI